MNLRLPPRRTDTLRIDTSLAIVNMVLLLIFFFVLAGQETVRDSDIELAETRDLKLDRLPSPILMVDAKGQWTLEGAEISPELLRSSMAGRGDTIFLMMDRTAPASRLVAVLSRPETQGFQIKLITIRDAAP